MARDLDAVFFLAWCIQIDQVRITKSIHIVFSRRATCKVSVKDCQPWRSGASSRLLWRLIDSGQTIDQALVDQVLGGGKRTDRGLKIAGLIVIFVAPGLAVLAWFVAQLSAPWLMPLLGTAALVAFVGIGLLVASKFAENAYREDAAPPLL